jgi:hypothetical protein
LHRGERCGVVGHPVGINPLAVLEQTAVKLSHVWDVAFALVFVVFNQRLGLAANNFGRVVTIEQESDDATLPHRLQAMTMC